MKFQLGVLTISSVLALAACSGEPIASLVHQYYWQRVEDSSALWMKGPKAQQQLDQDISVCVREIDELVQLNALRQTTPPDTHSEYHHALDASGDLDFIDTPTRSGYHMVSHTDFHDFESCMRTKGWERAKFVRYQTAKQAEDTYFDTRALRKWGLTREEADLKAKEAAEAVKADQDSSLNN